MKWLTQKQIKEAAKKSPKAAKDCVIEHWTQLATCTFKEFVWAVKQGKASIWGGFCAFCIRARNEDDVLFCSTKKCPVFLQTGCIGCSETPWHRAFADFNNFEENPTQANYTKFHKAAKKELKFLKSLKQ